MYEVLDIILVHGTGHLPVDIEDYLQLQGLLLIINCTQLQDANLIVDIEHTGLSD